MLLTSRLHGCGALLYTCTRLCACKHARVWRGWFFRKHLVITWYTVSVVGQRDPAQCSGSSWSQEGRSGDDSLLSCPTEARVSERLMSGSRSLLVEVGACAGSSSPVPHQDLIPGSFQPSKITRSARFSSFKWCSFLQYKAKHLWTSIL